MRMMLDSMIYDLLVEDLDLQRILIELIKQGEIVILTTHVQEDEHDKILENQEKKAKYLKIVDLKDVLLRDPISTEVFVLDYSRWDMAKLPYESALQVFDAIKTEAGNHIRDAMIGATAAMDADVLVTNDDRLQRRMADAPVDCEVWDFDHLRQYILEMSVKGKEDQSLTPPLP